MTISNTNGALDGHRYRTLVSTDIGGTDPDDFQSMVHLLLYADVLDIEGLLSSPGGEGRKEQILQVINCYEQDFEHLQTYSDRYPPPEALRDITKQGGVEWASFTGIGQSTEGSEWIVQCARRDDPRPLYVLGWGGLEDIAQALHDAPHILPNLRVYWIGGPNKKWSTNAYQYIADHHPELWMIETNAAYRGWFTGGNQSGEWGNSEFVAKYIAGHGALGDFFNTHLGGTIKMGDTPSVSWLLKGTPDDPSQPGWGGQFVRAWDRPHVVSDQLTTATDQIEEFCIFDLILPVDSEMPTNPEAVMKIENQAIVGDFGAEGSVRFRFSPKSDQAWHYTIHSNIQSLNGKTGEMTSFIPPSNLAQAPSAKYPNWWTDDPSPKNMEGKHIGAKTVNRWREAFLRDFAERMARYKAPNDKPLQSPPLET
jgi:hypothetical protein